MEKIKLKFILIHTLVFISSGFAALKIWDYLFPNRNFDGLVLIPTFFLVMGLAFIQILIANINISPKKLVNLYMLVKLVKMFVIVVFSVLFVFVTKCNLKDFALVLTVFYLLYIVLETYYFYQTEKYLKQNEKDK